MVASDAGRSASGKATRLWRGVALAAALAAALVLAFAVVADGRTTHRSSGLPQGDDPVHLKPGDFSANIDNPQWPMTVGSRWVYRVVDSSDGSVQHEVIRVTAQTKLIADGIEVPAGIKIGDVDPRGPGIDPTRISDKARAVAAGVLEAVLVRRREQAPAAGQAVLR